MAKSKEKKQEPELSAQQLQQQKVLQEVAAQQGQDCACDETIQVPEPGKEKE